MGSFISCHCHLFQIKMVARTVNVLWFFTKLSFIDVSALFIWLVNASTWIESKMPKWNKKTCHDGLNWFHADWCFQERRRVVVVSVCKFPGGVFTSCPDSYVVRRDGNVEQLTFSEWKAEILNQSRGKSDSIKISVLLLDEDVTVLNTSSSISNRTNANNH